MLEPIVYIVDDDPNTLESLSWMISSVGLQVKTFAKAQDFLSHYHPEQPGCLLLDARMPEISGPELQKNIKNNPQIILPIIFISGADDITLAIRVMKEGAMDFIIKPLNQQILLESINKAILADKERREKNQKNLQTRLVFSQLSYREKQILKGILDGKSNKSISNEIEVSIKTVEAHRASLMKKIGVKSIPHLIKLFFCIEENKHDPIFDGMHE